MHVQNKLTPEWWSPDGDDAAPGAASYRIRPLSGMEFLEVVPHMEVKNGFIVYTGKGMQTLLRYGLLDWKEHTDPETGEELPFSQLAMQRVPPFTLSRIAQEIASRCELAEAEVKNSERQSE